LQQPVLTSWFENFYLPEVRAVEFHFAVAEWVHACSSVVDLVLKKGTFPMGLNLKMLNSGKL